MITSENLWEIIIAHQGETFYTAKGLPESVKLVVL